MGRAPAHTVATRIHRPQSEFKPAPAGERDVASIPHTPRAPRSSSSRSNLSASTLGADNRSYAAALPFAGFLPTSASAKIA
ncbi:unnamed protein product [Cutaneotrichosporon oleaginosum]